MRLINADALSKSFHTLDWHCENNCKHCSLYYGVCEAEISMSDVQDTIELAKTVDAVPVVRCKDCKHSRNPNRKDYWENKACEGVLVCTNCPDSVRPEDGGYNFVDEDWFCADGEEKVSE